MSEVENYQNALEMARQYMSPRFRELDRLDRFVEGTQYDDRPDWFKAAADVPLLQRRPCVVYPVAKLAIRSHVSLAIGLHCFPRITIPAQKDFKKMAKRAHFFRLCRAVLRRALSSGTAVALFGLREDVPFVETIPAKWCEPTFDADRKTITKLEIFYPFIHVKRDAKKWEAEARLFRRVITDKDDTTFKSIKAEKGEMPAESDWTRDNDRSIEHGLGWCPIHWYPLEKEETIEDRIDGWAIHCEILDEITALDYALSQRQDATHAVGSPQPWETGVEPGYNPTGSASNVVSAPATPQGGVPPPGQRTSSYTGGSTSVQARKRGPRVIWQYESPDTKIGQLELSAGAVNAIAETCKDTRSKLLEILAFVPLDPDSFPGATTISGVSLDRLREKQYDRVDLIRDDFEDGFLEPALEKLYRVQDQTVDRETVSVIWPPYRRPGSDERSTLLTAELDNTAKAITLVDSPTFVKAAKKRVARLILDSDDDIETLEDIDDEIEENTPDEPPSVIQAQKDQEMFDQQVEAQQALAAQKVKPPP